MSKRQIRESDELKAQADEVFASSGPDLSTAAPVFLTIAVENNGLPLVAPHKNVSADLKQAIDDVRNRINLNGPCQTAQEAVDAMLED